MKTQQSEFPVPDAVLRDAYRKVALAAGMYRERFCARTENIEAVKREVGAAYAHVPVDDLRERIITCAKSPDRHGGGWSVTVDGHGAEKIGMPTREYLDYLQSPHWRAFRLTVLKWWDYRCCWCNRQDDIDVHHRTYERLGRELLQDCICLCRTCHKSADRCRKYIQAHDVDGPTEDGDGDSDSPLFG